MSLILPVRIEHSLEPLVSPERWIAFSRKFDVDAEISTFCTCKAGLGYKYFTSCDGGDLIARAQKKFVGRELSTCVARWLDLNGKASLFCIETRRCQNELRRSSPEALHTSTTRDVRSTQRRVPTGAVLLSQPLRRTDCSFLPLTCPTFFCDAATPVRVDIR